MKEIRVSFIALLSYHLKVDNQIILYKLFLTTTLILISEHNNLFF